MLRLGRHLTRAVALATAALIPATAVVTDGPPSAAEAAPGWGPIRVVGAGWRPAITVDARGTTTVVWEDGGRIRAVRRAPAGGWTTPVVIGRGHSPEVGVDGRGSVTAIWQTDRSGITTGVSTARRPAGEGWSAPVHLTQDEPITEPVDDTFGAQHLNLAVSPGGAVLASWAWGIYQDGPQLRVQAAYRPQAGRWSKAVNLTAANNSAYPIAGLDADGNAVLAFTTQPWGQPPILRSRRYPAGGSWTKAVTLAPAAWQEALAVDRTGNAIVLYTSDHDRLWTRYHPAGGGWRPARPLSPSGVPVDEIDLAMNARGAARAVHSDGDVVTLLARPPQGPWSAPEELGSGSTPVVALDRSGDTVVAWGLYDFYSRYRPSGGQWTDPFTIDQDRGDIVSDRDAVVTPGGDVVVVWVREEPTLYARVMTG